MRDLLLILALALAAAVLLVLVLQQDPQDAPTDLEEGPGPPPGGASRPAELEPPSSVAEVVPRGQWKLVMEPDEMTPMVADPRFRDHRQMRHPSGTDWFPTGAEVLDILTKATGGSLRLRFEDEQALEDFKQGRWPIAIPPEYHLSMLLDTAVEIGFQPIARADAVYMIRVQKDEPD